MQGDAAEDLAHDPVRGERGDVRGTYASRDHLDHVGPTTSSRVATSRTAQSNSDVLIPPGSGVPVPGAKAGSSTSMSTVKKTGPVPTASIARPTTSLIPSSLTSCMKRLVMPCSLCQANSSSPGQ